MQIVRAGYPLRLPLEFFVVFFMETLAQGR